MYADKYARRTKLDPGSLTLALLLNGTIVAGLIAFAAPTMFTRIADPGIDVINIPLQPPPPPNPPTPDTKNPAPTPKEIAAIPKSIVPTPPIDEHPYVAPTTPAGPIGGTIDGGGGVTPFKPTPVVIGAEIDKRFVNSFQPEYPPGERRDGREGRVTVRVLIGTDGRVKQVERVSAASDAFFASTQRRALEKWRFKPATRDGEPFEVWRTMSVSFVIKDED
jgi:protein TonB